MLFQLGEVTLSSGRTSDWKIECDALTPADWDTLARLATRGMPSFRQVVGVPTGGLAFARALEKYAEPFSPYLLICDDVWTTGRSMEEMRFHQRDNEGLPLGRIQGVVAFSRAKYLPTWARAVFSLHPAIAQVSQ